MKAFGITNPGLEEFAANEVEEILGVATTTKRSVVLFEATQEQLAELCYRTQSLIKVCSLLQEFELKSISDLDKINADFSEIKGTFRTKFAKQENSLSAQEIEPQLGEVVTKEHPEFKVDLKTPDYIVYLYANKEDAYIGIDYSGFDLAKRDYRVFANPKSVKGNIAYIMLKLADFKEGEVLLDPFCLSGEVGIEAALMLSGKSLNAFIPEKFAFNKFMKVELKDNVKEFDADIIVSSQQIKDIKAAQKNSKLAGIEKSIDFTRQDVEWLDMKFDDNSIDKLVTIIPCPSKMVSEKALKKIYTDLSDQIRRLIRKHGKVVILGRNLKYFKSLVKDVKVVKEVPFMNGQEYMEILVLEK